jgi:hypothetical protein
LPPPPSSTAAAVLAPSSYRGELAIRAVLECRQINGGVKPIDERELEKRAEALSDKELGGRH